jgi:hypothetical protein
MRNSSDGAARLEAFKLSSVGNSCTALIRTPQTIAPDKGRRRDGVPSTNASHSARQAVARSVIQTNW